MSFNIKKTLGLFQPQRMQMLQNRGSKRGRTHSNGLLWKVEYPNSDSVSPDAKLVTLIVTLNSGSSYDELFTSVAQKVGEGERASTYLAQSVDPDALRQLIELGDDAPICQTQPDAASLVADLAAIDPASVVFNWECCSGCSGDSFAHWCASSTVALIGFLLSKGYMVMVSDFSLGALIKEWDPKLLGPNPFVAVGSFNNAMTLRFEPTTLAACEDSAQLQILGELNSTGEANIHAQSGTKAYAVDPLVRPVRILTVVTELGGADAASFVHGRPHLLSSIGDHQGLAGHAIVEFKGGGRLLTSCPHWIELTKLEADEDVLLAVAKERYGEVYSVGLKEQFDAMGADTAKRRAFSNASACQFVRQSTAAKWVPSSRERTLKG